MNNIIHIAFSKWGRWAIISSWILFASILIITAPPLDETTNDAEFLPNTAESTEVFFLNEERFELVGTALFIVIRNNEGLSNQDYESARKIDSWLHSQDAPKAIESVISVFSVPGGPRIKDLASQETSNFSVFQCCVFSLFRLFQFELKKLAASLII